jgi:sigma-B regulation protein RsbU (phosphoserine phosphatase)
MLPQKFPRVKGVTVKSHYMPSGHLGGDMFDVIRVDDHCLAILMYDVSGHGVPAALVSVVTKTLFQKYFSPEKSLKVQLELVNEELHRDIKRPFYATAFYGILDVEKMTLRYVGAGFTDPLILRKDKVISLMCKGIPLGVAPEITSEQLSVNLLPGDKLLVFTDGLFEIFDEARQFFGKDKFTTLVNDNRQLALDKLLEKLVMTNIEFRSGSRQMDDITLLGIELGKDL